MLQLKTTNNMKTLNFIFLLCCTCLLPTLTQAQEFEWAIQPQFEWAGSFSEGLAAIKQNGKYGYINKQGQLVIQLQFDNANSFSEGLAFIYQNGQFGFINQQGQWIIQPQFTNANSFSEGLAKAEAQNNNKYGFINKNGEWIIQPKFPIVGKFSDGLAAVCQNGRWGFINKNGEWVIQPQFGWAFSFSKGLAAALQKNGKWGFIDKQGQWVIQPQFEDYSDFETSYFSEGLFSVKQNGKCGFIDKQGQWVIQPQFKYAYCFSEGLSIVGNSNVGFINKEGQWIIKPQFDFEKAKSFSEGLAAVEQNGKWGFIKNPLTNPVSQNKPTIVWQNPTSDSNVISGNFNIKVCVQSTSQISGVKVFVNGNEVYSALKAPQVVVNDGCQFVVERTISLQEGKNSVVIQAANSAGTTSSVTRTLTYQSPVVVLQQPKVYAVVVGVSDYSSDLNSSGIGDLTYCHTDADAVYRFLQTPEGGSVPSSQLIKLTNSQATKENILSSCYTLFGKAGANDLIMLFISGHGGKNVFVSYDAILSHEDLKKVIYNSKAKRKLCIADACHAGSWNKQASNAMLKGLSADETRALYYNSLNNSSDGLALFMSAQTGETSIDDIELRQGLFTYYYLEGLKGNADTNYDRIITISELYNYVKDKVSKRAVSRYGNSQTPELNGTFDHNMPIGIRSN